MRKGLTLAVLLVALLGASAQATIQKRATSIDSGKVLNRGHQVEVRAHVTCTRGEAIIARVTVTQRSTAALAVSGATGTQCTGTREAFSMKLKALGAERFARRKAKVCAVARTSQNGHGTDALQWCKAIRLT
jgi:hypothetical protein